MFMASTTPALSMQAACIITIPFFVCLKLTEQDVFDAYREEVSNHVFKSFKSFALAKNMALNRIYLSDENGRERFPIEEKTFLHHKIASNIFHASNIFSGVWTS